MFRKLLTRRRGVAMTTAAFGVSVMSLAFAGQAGATNNQTSVISASGSNTLYQMDLALADIFNQAPGCNLAGGSPQPLDFHCPTAYATGSTVNQPGENGEPATLENPNNDVVYNYPALGSGNGVHQIQGNPGSGDGEPDISYARSSADPANSHGAATNNYVQFATDGVSWVDFPSTSTKKVTSLTVAQLQAIYNNTLSCSIKGVTYTMDFKCLGAKTSTHIDCYMAQAGSGTEGTWASLVTGGSSTPACLNNEAHGTAASHNGLFENEVASIVDPASHFYNNDVGNAIYFFSAGKFSVECTPKGKSGSLCPAQPGNKVLTQLGKVDGIAASAATVQPARCVPNVPGDFPIVRCLSHVYNNSSATGGAGTAAAPATQPALNYASEYGFLCKPGTKTDVDPYTGLSYRFEIETAIIQNGFYPLETGYNASTQSVGNPFAEENTPLTFPAHITESNYQLVDPTYTQANPSGYCLPING